MKIELTKKEAVFLSSLCDDLVHTYGGFAVDSYPLYSGEERAAKLLLKTGFITKDPLHDAYRVTEKGFEYFKKHLEKNND